MKRVLAALCLIALAGCADIKSAANSSIDTLSHPPAEFVEFAKEALQWVIQIVLNFFADAGNPLFKFLGL